MHHGGKVLGPFDLHFIEAMVAGGVYPVNVPVQATGQAHARPLNEQQSLKPPSVPQTPAQPETRSPNPSGLPGIVAVALLGITSLGILGYLPTYFSKPASASNSTSSRSSSSTSSKPASQTRTSTSYNERDRSIGDSSTGSHSIASKYQDTSRDSRPATYPPSESRRLPSTSNSGTSSGRNTSSTSSSPALDVQYYRDASGQTYRVPNSDYYRLRVMKTALETKRQDLETAEANYRTLSNELDRDRRLLDRTSKRAVNAYNQKVSRLNATNGNVQALSDQYNKDVDAFNAELNRVGTPIR